MQVSWEQFYFNGLHKCWQLFGFCACVHVLKPGNSVDLSSQTSTLKRGLSTTPGANRDSLPGFRLTAYLPREANWVRQMEQEHERCLIPFEDVDGERNPQQWGCLLYSLLSHAFFFNFWESKGILKFTLL